MTPAKPSLYSRIGGEGAILAAVDRFYAKVLADELTRPFFEGLDMGAQVQKQVAFIAWALGAPVEYKGRDLRTAHAQLVRERGLGDRHFDAVARHLEVTLRELDLGDDLVEEALATVARTRDEVLNR